MLKKVPKIITFIPALFLILGCAVEIPWVYRADQKPIYASKYFTVKPPAGTGWEYRETTPSKFLSTLFKYETDLFDEFIPQRVCFLKYAAKDLWPHPPDKSCYIEFYSIPTDPERFNYDEKLLAEAENRKYLPSPHLKEIYPHIGLKRMDKISMGDREFYEFEFSATSDRRLISLQFIAFSKDVRIMYIINLPYIYKKGDKLPKDVHTLIQGFEPVEKEVSAKELVMEGGSQILYNLTQDFIYKHHYPDSAQSVRAIEDLQLVISSEPDNFKAHLFLGATYLIMHKVKFPENIEGQDVCQGVWDFYRYTYDGEVFHSLLLVDDNTEKALEHFENAHKLKPDSYWANYYTAGFYLKQKDYDKAIARYQNLIKYFPESALAWYMLGIAYKESGKTEKALEVFKTASKKNKGDFPKLWWGKLKGKDIIDYQISRSGAESF